MIVIRNILAFITDPKNTRMLLLGFIVVLCMLLLRQCGKTNAAESEIVRVVNNQKALNDTIENYINENGNAAAEIRALSLTIEEVEDELEFEKNKPPVTVIKTETVIEEKIVEVPVTVVDTIIGNFNSALSFTSKNEWGNSFREIAATVPYTFSADCALFGEATIDLKQNIWLTASLIRDKKTKELFVNLETDYPGTTFNSAKGIMIDQSSSAFKDIQLQNRKAFGLGFHVGYGISLEGPTPYLGLGVHYSPKFLQW